MVSLDPRQLKRLSGQRLSSASYDPRRLTLIHTGVALICSLVLTVINYLLSQQVSGTGGLEGIGTRSILQSAQSVLSLIVTVGTPFWNFGFVAAVMGYARKKRVHLQDLTTGFRRFGPILRLLLLQAVLYIVIAILATQVASVVILATPLGNEAAAMVEQLATNTQFIENGVLPDEMVLPLLKALLPAYIAAGVLFAVVAIPVSYRLRLAQYMVLEEGQNKAMVAIRTSRMCMRGNCMAMFKLDLSLWWYWLLQALCSLLVFGDVLLAMAGIQLPISADAAVFLFYGLQMLASLALAWYWRAPVETTYALAYDTLTGKIQEEN